MRSSPEPDEDSELKNGQAAVEMDDKPAGLF